MAGFIENWGTGFQRIIKTCIENGNPTPVFEEKAGAFVITFKKRNLSAQETAQETIRKKILQLLKENPGYTKNDLIKILGKSDGTIKKHLANLKNNGLLERVGSTKAGHWKVKSKS